MWGRYRTLTVPVPESTADFRYSIDVMRALVCLALTLAACGGDPESDSVTSKSGPPNADSPNTMGDGDAGLAGDAPEPVQIPEDAPVVVVLGDSLAAGLHLPADRAFPAVLQRQLAAQGQPFHLRNAGVSGDTSAGGLARLDWQLKQKPDVLVLELGANDGLRGVKTSATEENLREILRRTQAAGVQPLLLGMRVPPSLGKDYSESFAAIFPRLAKEFGIPFVPFFIEGVGGVPSMNLPDGMHPTPEGHERIAENIAPALAEVLAALPPR